MSEPDWPPPPERRARAGPGQTFVDVLPAGTRNLLLTLEYDGNRFSGFQEQPGRPTVQGALQAALGRLARHHVIVRGAGRTDAGVHALAQRAAFYTTATMPPERWARGIAGLCDGVVAHAVQEMPLAFDPRRDAVGKVYAYRVLARMAPSPLRQGQVLHVPAPLDRERLRAALALLPGTRDWSSFRAADCAAPDPVKTLHRAELEERGDEVVLRFAGSGFLKQMVRILVGSVLEVGLGRRSLDWLAAARDAADRGTAGPTAPACGLVLERVLYPDDGP